MKWEWENNNIQIFYYKQLIINCTQHILVPEHIHITDPYEIKDILKHYRVSNRTQLPVILTTDPICRYYRGRPNDLFKIIRTSGYDDGIIYRVVVQVDINIDDKIIDEEQI